MRREGWERGVIGDTRRGWLVGDPEWKPGDKGYAVILAFGLFLMLLVLDATTLGGTTLGATILGATIRVSGLQVGDQSLAD